MMNTLVKKLSIVACVLFTVVTSTNAQTAIATADSGKVVRNLRYAMKPDSIGRDTTQDRLLDLYLPVAGKTKSPVIVLIHGGGFSGGDKKSTGNLASALARYGYAVVNINYRLEMRRKRVAGVSASSNMAAGIPANGFHAVLHNAVAVAAEDAQLALKWVKENAAQYNFDVSKVAIGGGSAGAMTALYTAYASNQNVLPIKAVINLWGGLEDINAIKKASAPVITYHGDMDKLINVSFAQAIQNKKQEQGDKQSEIHIMEGKGHARYDFILKEKVPEIDAFLKKVMR